MFGLGLFRGLAGLAFIATLVSSVSAPLAVAASTFRTPLVALGGFFILSERTNLRIKVLSALLATVGLILLG